MFKRFAKAGAIITIYLSLATGANASAPVAGPTNLPVDHTLYVPHQIAAPGVFVPNADPSSARYAVQVGFAWMVGDGVYPNFPQARAWFYEAQRRSKSQGDQEMFGISNESLYDLNVQDIPYLWRKGQEFGDGDGAKYARFYFGRAAELGDVQGMAALAWIWAHSYQNTEMGIYWCRQAYTAAKIHNEDYELDAVNYFCPIDSIRPLMTDEEFEQNKVSVARAEQEAQQNQRDMEAVQAFAKSVSSLMGGYSDDAVKKDIDVYESYSEGTSDEAPPTSSGFYGNCHGGAAYGC